MHKLSGNFFTGLHPIDSCEKGLGIHRLTVQPETYRPVEGTVRPDS